MPAPLPPPGSAAPDLTQPVAVAKNANIDPLAGIEPAALRFRCSALRERSLFMAGGGGGGPRREKGWVNKILSE
jgi:hypothetical protein